MVLRAGIRAELNDRSTKGPTVENLNALELRFIADQMTVPLAAYIDLMGNLVWPQNGDEILARLEDHFAQTYYESWPNSQLDIVRAPHFCMLIDWQAQPESTGDMRSAGVFGNSAKATKPRDKKRMSGLYGPTRKIFGPDYDKGHYISRAMGGDDAFENANLFPQLSHINQGRSELGKLYQDIERHCLRNEGSLFFSRPVYEDETWHPAAIEVGIWREGAIEAYQFPNKP